MCCDIEILQQVIDEEYDGDMESVHEHMKSCLSCRQTFETLRRSQNLVESALNTGIKIPVNRPEIMEDGMERILNKKRGDKYMNMISKKWVATAAAVAICAGLFSLQPVRTKASEFLKLFRVNEVTGISIDQKELSKINQIFQEGNGKVDIKDFATIDVTSNDQKFSSGEIKDAAEIRQKDPTARLILPPDGMKYQRYDIQPKADATLKLNIAKINDFLVYIGEKIKLPKTLDGQEFRIHSGDILSYTVAVPGDSAKGKYAQKNIRVTQMNTPTLEIPEGVEAGTLINALLSLQILPENIKQQLRSIGDLTTTLPIPYNAERQVEKDITVKGHKGIMIEPKDGEKSFYSIFFKMDDKFFVVNSNGISVEELTKLLNTME